MTDQILHHLHLKLSWENEAKPNNGLLSLHVESCPGIVTIMTYEGPHLDCHLVPNGDEIDQIIAALQAAKKAAGL